MSVLRTGSAQILDYCLQCDEREQVVEIASVEEWDAADLPGAGASVSVSEFDDHVIVYEEGYEQTGVVGVGNRRRDVTGDARGRRPEVPAVNDELLNVAAGILVGIGALVIKQEIFPDVSGLVPGVAFVTGVYALSTQTDDSL